jgi:hypothetical protein
MIISLDFASRQSSANMKFTTLVKLIFSNFLPILRLFCIENFATYNTWEDNVQAPSSGFGCGLKDPLCSLVSLTLS